MNLVKLLLGIGLLLASTAQARDVMVVGESFPPFEYLDGRKATGANDGNSVSPRIESSLLYSTVLSCLEDD